MPARHSTECGGVRGRGRKNLTAPLGLSLNTDSKKTPGPWYIVAIVTATQLVVAMSNILLPTIAPKLAETLGVSAVLIGYQVSLTFGAATLATVIAGNAVLRFGAVRTTQIAMLSCIAGSALFAFPNLVAIAVGSLAIGLSMGLTNPAAAHILVSHTPAARRNLMFSIKQTGVPVGGVITALTAPVIAVKFGFQWSLALVSLLAIGVLAATVRHRAVWDADRGAKSKETGTSFGGVPLVVKTPNLRWISLAAAIFSAIQRCVLSFTVIYLVAEKQVSLIEAGVMLSVVQLGGSVARICWGWLADKLGSSILVLAIIAAITTAALFLLAILDIPQYKSVAYVLFFVLGTTSLGWNGVFHAEAARLSPPGLVSMTAAGTTFFVFGGVLIGPSLFVVVYGLIHSYAQSFMLVALSSLLSMGLLAVARRATPRESS